MNNTENNESKLITIPMAMKRYQLGRHTLMRVAEESGAIHRISYRVVRLDPILLDEALKKY